MYKIVVLTPSNYTPSGGPEALHQLVNVCNEIENGSAAILYEPENVTITSIEPYKKYNCPVISKKDLDPNSLLIIPEVWPHYAEGFTNRCALWWLSVGFFNTQMLSCLSDIDLHLTQSFYAKDYVSNIVNKPIYMLTDWIDYNAANYSNKKDRICVNPSKGLDLIDYFSSRNQSLSVIKIQNMNKEMAMVAMAESKVYIDFGHHPGRDRMPREAALNDCLVFVRKQGAAKFYEDVPIDEWFKFDTIEEIEEKIYIAIENYENLIKKQQSYKHWCLNNKYLFKQEVTKLLEMV